MVVMGVDQSLTCTGICIMRDLPVREVLHIEAIRTSKIHEDIYEDVFERGKAIALRIQQLSRDWDVDHIQFEALSLGSSGNATRNLAMLLGIIITVLWEKPATVPPNTLKKYATGNGRAIKQEMLAAIEPVNPKLWEDLNNTTIAGGKYDIVDAFWAANYAMESK